MNIGGVAIGVAETVATTGNQTKDAAAVAVLRQSLDMQEEIATKLIESIPEPAKATSSNPSLGGNIDTFA
ncbi:MAG: putative motility protein [Gammaproteobacteria bacterium]|nr:putative motility protein [Gammaproteobacteria bacterium]